jgi:RNA polymerase sigma-70 factor, ECF subfamily
MRLRATAAPSDLDAALPRLRRYARVLTDVPEEADALLLRTLERAAETAQQCARQEPVRTRLFGLMHELHVGQHASSGVERAEPGNEAARAPEPSRLPALLTHFGRLPVEEREVLLLAAVEQMAYEDIASVLGVPPATVIARLKLARERMRAAATAGAVEGAST